MGTRGCVCGGGVEGGRWAQHGRAGAGSSHTVGVICALSMHSREVRWMYYTIFDVFERKDGDMMGQYPHRVASGADGAERKQRSPSPAMCSEGRGSPTLFAKLSMRAATQGEYGGKRRKKGGRGGAKHGWTMQRRHHTWATRAPRLYLAS